MPISETESAYKPIIYGQQTPIGSGQKEPSITNRIIGSVLMELNDVYSVEEKLTISKKHKAQLEECTSKLIVIAKEQQRLLAA